MSLKNRLTTSQSPLYLVLATDYNDATIKINAKDLQKFIRSSVPDQQKVTFIYVTNDEIISVRDLVTKYLWEYAYTGSCKTEPDRNDMPEGFCIDSLPPGLVMFTQPIVRNNCSTFILFASGASIYQKLATHISSTIIVLNLKNKV